MVFRLLNALGYRVQFVASLEPPLDLHQHLAYSTECNGGVP